MRGDRAARVGLVVANCWQYRNKIKPCEKIDLSCSLIASSCAACVDMAGERAAARIAEAAAFVDMAGRRDAARIAEAAAFVDMAGERAAARSTRAVKPGLIKGA